MPIEPTTQLYDVGAITRQLQDRFRIFKKTAYTHEDIEPLGEPGQNRVTPKNVSKLLDALTRITSELRAKRSELSGWAPDIAIQQWDADMAAWEERLAAYRAAVAVAPTEDRQSILWDVTAPLLVGYYGGEDSTEPQQPIDAITPFSLANQLAVDMTWREERERLFWADLKEAALDVAKVGLGLAGLVAFAVAGFLLAGIIISRSKHR